MKRFTVTKGNSPDDAVTSATDDEEETRLDAPYVAVRLNVAIDGKKLMAALNALDK